MCASLNKLETGDFWNTVMMNGSACVFATVNHGGGGVMVWGCCAGDIVSVLVDLFSIQGTLNSVATTTSCSDRPSGQRKGCSTRKESDKALRLVVCPCCPEADSRS